MSDDKKILILGGPRTGKTTYAKKLASEGSFSVQHFDDYIDEMEWSELSDRIADEWLNEPGSWIKEGVQGVRGLRKWLKANKGKKPPFEIHVLRRPKVERTKGQESMQAAHDTILKEVLKILALRRVKITYI